MPRADCQYTTTCDAPCGRRKTGKALFPRNGLVGHNLCLCRQLQANSTRLLVPRPKEPKRLNACSKQLQPLTLRVLEEPQKVNCTFVHLWRASR